MVRPRRSVLYMPGSNERALQKATAIPADALILDLEDAVAPDEKAAAARERVAAMVRARPYGRREVVIRVNALETPWGIDDLRTAVEAEPDAILVPVSRLGDMTSAAKILASLHAAPAIRLWAMMETPASILNARDIAAVAADPGSRFACLVLGTNDLPRNRGRGRSATGSPSCRGSPCRCWRRGPMGSTSSTASTMISATRPAFARNASRGGPSAWMARR